MDLLGSLAYGLTVSLAPANLMACFVGVFVGTLIGVLPGIGPVATMSLLLPVTYAMSPAASIIMLAGIYYGAMYGGSTTSILANIPGEAASVVTCLDGYQMARAGRAGPALGIAAFGSFIAGTLSVLGITVLAPPLARVALRFGPPEIFAVLLLGFTLVTHLTGGSKLRTAAMALLGMLLGTVGIDPISGVARFTFGTLTLNDGVGLVPMIMGLFGVSEVFLNIEVQVAPARVQGTDRRSPADARRLARRGRSHRPRERARLHPRHRAGNRRHHPDLHRVRPGEAPVEASRTLRPGRHRGRGGAGGGQQRGHGRRADSAPHPRRGAQRCRWRCSSARFSSTGCSRAR